MATCGDFGGVTTKNEWCKRPAGWGVPGTDTGRCKTHLEQEPAPAPTEPQTYTPPPGYAFAIKWLGTVEKATSVTLSPFHVKQEEPELPPDPEPTPSTRYYFGQRPCNVSGVTFHRLEGKTFGPADTCLRVRVQEQHAADPNEHQNIDRALYTEVHLYVDRAPDGNPDEMSDDAHFIIEPPKMAPGSHTLAFVMLMADGASETGTATFTVTGTSPVPEPEPTPEPTPEPPPVPAGAIALTLLRYRSGIISNGVPLPPGWMSADAGANVRLLYKGAEQALFVKPLAGRHADGKVRSVLIQADFQFANGDTAELRFDAPRTRHRAEVPIAPDFATPVPAAVALPSSVAYLLSTGIVMPTTPAADPFSTAYEARFVTQSDGRYGQLVNDWATLSPDAAIGRNYYDRALIHWAWWVRTADPRYWERAVAYLIAWREKYARGWDYGMQPHQMMVEGLELHYLLTGDAESRRGVQRFAENYGAANWMDWASPAGLKYSEGRIQSRILLSLITATRLGFDYRAQAKTVIGWMAEMQNVQGFWPYTATCGGNLNFMSALQLEVAIQYHTYIEADARILPMAQKLAEWLWTTQWQPDGSFNYISVQCNGVGSPGGQAWDLNMLFLPLFGWLYKQTGDAKWRTRGDEIFAQGVAKAWFGSNFQQADKQFNESYRSSYQYLALRK